MNPRETIFTDADILQQIRTDLLEDDRLSSQNIEVDLQNGIATLTGSVASFRRKLAAQLIVASYAGIRDVRNELAVEPSQPVPDAEVIENVRAALNSSADITKETIIVSVVNGLVALTGTVASNWERVTAEDIVRGTRGVRDVGNMLTVDNVRADDDEDQINRIQAALGRARGLDSADIHVATGADTVVLSGTVETPWQRDVAETVVGRFGFCRIRNEIQIVDR